MRRSDRYAAPSARPPALDGDTQPPDAPDEYLDLKESSAQDVSVAQVSRAQAQAAAVRAAAGQTFCSRVQLRPPSSGSRAIVVDPTDADHVCAAFSGYRRGRRRGQRLRDHRRRRHWHDISLDLPNGPFEDIAYDQPHHVLYAATGFGLFNRAGGDGHWYDVGAGGRRGCR